ncbi:MAG: hypothetical protein E7E64_04895 [Clostridium celatum]|uniref:hypothetical protein n=1 Tax=Clostridium tertium TaxID=1559 RepID=UPI0029028E75|nr:hypothetical protein [Clostridium celatum]
MNTALRFMRTVTIFFALMALIFDIAQINHIKRDMKDSLDLSTKAAALQLDENPIKIGKGIFEIDVSKAKSVNKEIFMENLDINFENAIISTDILNVHSKTLYNAPSGKKYTIDSPTIFCTATYRYDGFFIDRDINVNLLSASVLRNKNDLRD